MAWPSLSAMHLWNIPDMLHLYSSPLMIVYTLDHRVMHCSSVMSSRSSPWSKYARKGYVQVASARNTWTSESSAVGIFSLVCIGGFEAVRFGLIDLCSMRSRKIPGGICDLVEPRLASMSTAFAYYVAQSASFEFSFHHVVEVAVGDHVVCECVTCFHCLFHD